MEEQLGETSALTLQKFNQNEALFEYIWQACHLSRAFKSDVQEEGCVCFKEELKRKISEKYVGGTIKGFSPPEGIEEWNVKKEEGLIQQEQTKKVTWSFPIRVEGSLDFTGLDAGFCAVKWQHSRFRMYSDWSISCVNLGTTHLTHYQDSIKL